MEPTECIRQWTTDKVLPTHEDPLTLEFVSADLDAALHNFLGKLWELLPSFKASGIWLFAETGQKINVLIQNGKS